MDITEKNGSSHFTVRVLPRASKSEIAGEHDGSLKVRIASPPVDGAANAELVKLIAKWLGIAKSDVEIVGGQTSRTKRIRINGRTASEISSILKAKS